MCALALTKNAGHTLESKAYAATVAQNSTASFTWSMPKRFGSKRGDGIADYHWNGSAYGKDYVNPTAWKVDFDACTLNNTPDTTFLWTVDGVALPNPTPASCSFSHEFTAQGTYTVTLTRTTSDGMQTTLQAPVTVKDLLIVSLGDSFASGQGNPDIPKEGSTRAKWVDEICARSFTAGPAQAAFRVEEDDPHTSVTFLSYACTGAQVLWGILAEQTRGQVRLPAQIERLKDELKGRPIDALIISGGGNDIEFANLVASCVFHLNCQHHSGTLNKVSAGLDSLDARYQALSTRIAALPPVKKIFITEYPDLVRDEDGDPCDGRPKTDPLRLIKGDEAEWASEDVIGELNRKVKKAADWYGWIYVTGISDRFRTHGYCTGDDERWVRTFRDARQTQGTDGKCDLAAFKSVAGIRDCIVSSGTFHPNEKGHQAYSLAIIEALRTSGLIVAPSS